MQIATEQRGCETSNNFAKTKHFSIKHSPKMFKMLSDGVYQDKLKAWNGEITANMLDEYNMSDTKKPFEITLPTQLSPVMEFKDYGRGLSEEDVFDLYTTYGASTKDTVNSVEGQDIIGGFGIGSKSPFAYTDSFIVESRHEGILRTYVAMLDDARMPTIVQTSSKEGEKTAEPNGLTVKVAVQQNDIRQCSENMKDILEFFPVQPIIHNAPAGWEVNKKEYLIENDKIGFKLSKNTYYSKARIILGGRSFPIDFDQIEDKYEGNYRGLDIWMPMGSVDVTVSRESLSYDPLTIKNILAKLEEIEIAIQDDATKSIKKIKNKYLRTIEYTKISGQGLLLNTQAFRDRCDALDYYSHRIDYKYIDSAYSSSRLVLRKNTYFNFNFRKEAIFIIVDDASCCDIKTKQFVEDNSVDYHNTIVYQIPAHKWTELYKELGKPPKSCVHYTSKLTYTKKVTGKASVRGLSCYRINKWHQKVPYDVQDLTDDKHYLIMDNDYVYINESKYRYEEASYLIPDNTYLIFKTNRGKVVEYGWTEGSSLIVDHCKEVATEHTKKNLPFELYDLLDIETDLLAIKGYLDDKTFKVSAYNSELVKKTAKLCRYVTTMKESNVVTQRDYYSTRRQDDSAYVAVKAYLDKQGETIDARKGYDIIAKKLEKLEKGSLLQQWYKAFPLIRDCDNNVTLEQKVDYLSKWG